MLDPLLGALRFKCSNTAYRAVMDAIDTGHGGAYDYVEVGDRV
jgi:hypothetical protein